MRDLVEMNFSSYPTIPIIPIVENIPPAIKELSHDAVKAGAFLLIPAELLYFAIYSQRKGLKKFHKCLIGLSLLTLWAAPLLSPVTW